MQRKAKIGLAVGVGVCATIAIIVIVVVSTNKGKDGPIDGPWDEIRLPKNIKAEKYKMSLNIDWEHMNYTGTQEVTMNVTGEETQYFLIHTTGLVIDKDATTLHQVVNGSDEKLEIRRTFMDTEKKPELKHDFYVVESEMAVAAGIYKMMISFAGKVQTERLTGMYRSKYIRKGGKSDETIYQISTDFEPVDARSAFPCFDEPAQKAKWTVDITVKFPSGINIENYNIIGNMPLKEDQKKESQTISAMFKESVPMSTYLVCFAISDFAYKEKVHTRKDGSKVKMRVYARREQDFQDSASYALEVTPHIIEKYEEFYKVAYPLEKLDQIALPEFNSGAMENWGLITYRESSLLYNPVTSSTAEKQRVCSVIAHEVAHQWFGNLVTMAWWNDLWLNEGFASFVEYYGIDASEPTWNILDFFYPDEVTTAMNFDSSPSSHPISVQVSSPEELSGLFDTVSYRKGSSINWMMQKFMGDDNFATGLANYIAKHKYGNAEMVDLFEALNSAAGGVNVTKVMLTWTMQMGFPYVTATLDTTTNPGSTIITLEQNRFLVGDAKENDTSEYNYEWHIPFSFVYKVKDGGVEKYDGIHWFWSDDDKSKTITVDKELEWIKGNVDGNFYYLVNYEEATLTALAAALEKGELTNATDKTSLIYDVFSMAETGKVEYTKALDMTKYAKNEKEYVVLSRILSEVLSAGDRIKSDKTAYGNFWQYVVDMLKPRVVEMTWENKTENEPITAPKLRDMALRNYCKAVQNKTDEFVKEALSKFTEFAKDPKGQKSGIKDVFTTVMRTAIIYDDDDNTNWEKMWKLLQDSDWEADQRIYIAALARSKNQTVLRRMINDSFAENAKAGTWRYLYYVSGDHCDLAWELLQKNWDRYAVKYNTTSFTMGYLIEIPEVFDTQEKYEEVKAFFDSKESNIGTGKKTVEETLAKIKSNMKWKKDHFEKVKKWFTGS